MNGYITAGYLDQKVDLPISLPMTLLRREDWLVVATLKVQPPMVLQFDELQLNVAKLTVEAGANSGLIANSRGKIYAAIFKDYTQNDPATLVPQGSSVDVLVATDTGIWVRAATAPLALAPPATSSYSVVLVNNTRNTDAYVSLTGQLRLALVA